MFKSKITKLVVVSYGECQANIRQSGFLDTGFCALSEESEKRMRNQFMQTFSKHARVAFFASKSRRVAVNTLKGRIYNGKNFYFIRHQ